ncbi:YesL family protein [Anaerosporobacter sp.]|uniref:YesL family protein n=1 Tax=Anaerosporobacter sp. TaxID=1872529 RepID=UPI00286EE0AB|nr:DUF624 domain-containing protein [Anaerosporobacter sp.]
MGKVFDIVLVSLLWVVCCIPIITIGPATTALYYSVVKSIRRERGYITKEFFHSFKTNFKQGTITGVIFTVFAVIMSVNFYVVKQMDTKVSTVLIGIYLVLCAVVFITALYAFPNLSRFTLTIKHLFKNSLIMSIRHLPMSIVMALIVLVALFLMYLVPIATLFVPGVSCLLVSFMMERILKRYTPEDVSRADAWYME